MTKKPSIANIINIRWAVTKITNTVPNNIEQCKAELINFLRKHRVDDLIIDPDNIEELLELSQGYSDLKMIEVLSPKVIAEIENLYEGKEIYERVGKVVETDRATIHTASINKLCQSIIKLHPDLTYRLIQKKQYVSFYDNEGLIFEYGNMKEISNTKDVSGSILFHRIKLEEINDIIPDKYLKEKVWAKVNPKDKFITTEYYTFTELLDLIANRKIVTHGNYL